MAGETDSVVTVGSVCSVRLGTIPILEVRLGSSVVEVEDEVLLEAETMGVTFDYLHSKFRRNAMLCW
jgi:hypothetical protein